ncbi:MAG TPA: DUF3047 domain-containing protein [bacterium]|nr:DUF3047 domain-containing protein [bacterium]
MRSHVRGARAATLRGLILAAVVALGGALAQPPLVHAQEQRRLDDFSKTYPGNQTYGDWDARKFSPRFGDGEKYFFQFVDDGHGEHYLHLMSGKDNSFSVGYKRQFQLKDWPVLEWEWKMGALPKGGNSHAGSTDDEAGQMCVIVNPGLFGSQSICYLFDNGAAKSDQAFASPQGQRSQYIVLRSAAGGDATGTWYPERRNIYEDYKRVFGKEPEKEAAIGILINSQHTASSAEAFYRNIVQRKS